MGATSMKRGIRIGNYVLSELLNTGGMGQVWLGLREFEGGGKISVAIKFPHAAGVLDPRIRGSLQDEARLQMRLQHPNIPRVTDMGVHEGLPYFVMDYIAGRSLAQLLTRMRDLGTPLRFEIVAHIAREIGYALRFAHTFQIDGVWQQVIHRDVAPKNTLVSGQGGVYVVDFGVAEAVGMNSSRNHIKGTLLYMAPEHALGFPSTKSDGWGLGAIMWEMIEGRQFRGEVDADDLRRAANQGRHAPLARPGIPDALRFVTEGLLRPDERDRLTLDEVLAPLETAEFPPQRSALADLLKRRFGGSVHRSGQTLHDFEMPEQLDQTIAAARVVKDAGPFRLGAWADEAFAAAGAPTVVPVSGTRPIPRAVALDDDDDSAPRPVRTEPLPHVHALVSPSEPVPRTELVAPRTERMPAPAPPRQDDAVVSPVPDITEVFGIPRTPPDREAPSVPALPQPTEPVGPLTASTSAIPGPMLERTTVRWMPYAGAAIAVWLTVGAVLWALGSWGADHQAPPMVASAEEPAHVATVVETPETIEANAAMPEPELAVEPAFSAEPELPLAVEPERVVRSPVEPELVAPSPVEHVDPGAAVEPVEPAEPAEPAEPPRTTEPQTPPAPKDKPKPARKTAKPDPRLPLPESRIAIALAVGAPMDIDIDGVQRSLTVREHTAEVRITPGRVWVRWRRPVGDWKRRRVVIEPGVDYKVWLDGSGPTIKPIERKAP
jgi:eukaryotic-like serine/threonine-protein kinase